MRAPCRRHRKHWSTATAVLVAGLSMSVLVTTAASASTVVVVRPSAPNGWTVGGSGVIATGQPAGGLGAGAVQVESEVASTGRGFARTDVAPVAGTRLTDLTRVDYRVAVTAYPPASQFLTGYVVVFLALDGNPANTGNAAPGQPNLVAVIYEPCYAQPANCSGTIQPLNVWKTWSATPASPAWWNADAISGHAPGTVFSTLDTVVLGAFPNSVITAMKVQVGQGGAGAPWQGWHGWLDGVRFVAGGAAPVDELVDFEPNLPALPGPPTHVLAAAATTSVTITWSPPTTGGPVTGYTVVVDGVTHHLPASARSLTVGAPGPGSTVHASVAAVNAAGTGPAVSVQATVSPAARPSPSPTNSPSLPATGTSPAQGYVTISGVSMILLGLVLLAASTRRREDQ